MRMITGLRSLDFPGTGPFRTGARDSFALLLVVFLLGTVPAAHAATYTVNNTGDAVDVNPGDGVCETAPGNGICTLRAAIQETNALAPQADTVAFSIPNTDPGYVTVGLNSWWRISPATWRTSLTATFSIHPRSAGWPPPSG